MTFSRPAIILPSSVRARDGISSGRSKPPGAVPVRSRIARRYESVATRRRPSGSGENSTPVSARLRLSSRDAAFTTWPRPSASAAASSSITWPVGSGSWGHCSEGISLSENSERPEVIRTSVWSLTTSTAPESSDRTMSFAFAGMTMRPSSSPRTSSSAVMVSSRSVPMSWRRPPSSSAFTPDATPWCALRLPAAGRLTSARASVSTSRSHRNRTATTSLSSSISTGRGSSRPCGLGKTYCFADGARVCASTGCPQPSPRQLCSSTRVCGASGVVHRSPAGCPPRCPPVVGARRGRHLDVEGSKNPLHAAFTVLIRSCTSS